MSGGPPGGDKITDWDPEDWLLKPDLPFKRPRVKPHPKPRRLKQVLRDEKYEELPASTPTFVNIEAPPSIYPPKRYCDLTGFEAPYTDPRTGLRYASAPLFPVIRNLPSDQVNEFLRARNALVILK